MGSLNKVLLIGRIGQEPEKRLTPAGHSVVNISLATSEFYKDQSGQRQSRTEWHKVVFWNRQAEIVEQYCRKGSQIFVEGALQTREWQDKDGNRRFSTDIVARSLQMLDSKPQQGQQNYGAASNAGYQNNQQNSSYQGNHSTPPNQDVPTYVDDYVEDDIPF